MYEPAFQARFIRSASSRCSAIASSAVSRKPKKLPAIRLPWNRLLPARATTSAMTAPKLANTLIPILMLPNQAKADLPAGLPVLAMGVAVLAGVLDMRGSRFAQYCEEKLLACSGLGTALSASAHETLRRFMAG